MEEGPRPRVASAIPDTTEEITIYAQPLVQEMKRMDQLEAAERGATRPSAWRNLVRTVLNLASPQPPGERTRQTGRRRRAGSST